MVTVAGCSYRRDVPPGQTPNSGQQQTPLQNMQREDKLAKSDKENGYTFIPLNCSTSISALVLEQSPSTTPTISLMLFSIHAP